MVNMERFAPLDAITYAILNGVENLRFDKEGVSRVNCRGSLGELVLRARVSTSISRSPKRSELI